MREDDATCSGGALEVGAYCRSERCDMTDALKGESDGRLDDGDRKRIDVDGNQNGEEQRHNASHGGPFLFVPYRAIELADIDQELMTRREARRCFVVFISHWLVVSDGEKGGLAVSFVLG